MADRAKSLALIIFIIHPRGSPEQFKAEPLLCPTEDKQKLNQRTATKGPRLISPGYLK